jgi:hypothetical protein
MIFNIHSIGGGGLTNLVHEVDTYISRREMDLGYCIRLG